MLWCHSFCDSYCRCSWNIIPSLVRIPIGTYDDDAFYTFPWGTGWFDHHRYLVRYRKTWFVLKQTRSQKITPSVYIYFWPFSSSRKEKTKKPLVICYDDPGTTPTRPYQILTASASVTSKVDKLPAAMRNINFCGFIKVKQCLLCKHRKTCSSHENNRIALRVHLLHRNLVFSFKLCSSLSWCSHVWAPASVLASSVKLCRLAYKGPGQGRRRRSLQVWLFGPDGSQAEWFIQCVHHPQKAIPFVLWLLLLHLLLVLHFDMIPLMCSGRQLSRWSLVVCLRTAKRMSSSKWGLVCYGILNESLRHMSVSRIVFVKGSVCSFGEDVLTKEKVTFF